MIFLITETNKELGYMGKVWYYILMKIEKLNENQLRFTVWNSDLPDQDLTISDLTGHSEKADELIRYMMDKAREEFGFEADQQPVVVEAIPVNKDCIVFLVTKIDEENPDSKYSYIQELKNHALDIAKSLKTGNLESSNLEQGNVDSSKSDEEDSDKVLPYMIFTSEDMEKFITVSKMVLNYYDSDNTLYKSADDKTYYLIVSHNRNSDQEFRHVCESLREFAEPYKFNYATKYYMEEHFRKVIKDSALQTLAEL